MQRTHLREGDEGVAPGLSHHGTALVEQHVELLDGAAFLHQFEELKPIGGNAKGTISTSGSHNFGYGCGRHCICEIPGQVPCPGTVPLPDHMRGKVKFAPK